MTTVLQTEIVRRFSCLGERCADTCCKNWSMQVDSDTLARYEQHAPELLEAVETSEESPWIMRKDQASGYCVKLDHGMCTIHASYGDRFLSDACHFYPRVTRRIKDQVLMSATLSCPEIARLALFEAEPGHTAPVEIERLPSTLKDCVPDILSSEDALAIHHAFLDAAADSTVRAEHALLRIASASRSLELIDLASWPRAVPFYLNNADMRLPASEPQPADPFNLLHALCGLVVASHAPMSQRLEQTITDMEQALSARLNWQSVTIEANEQSLADWQALHTDWQAQAATRFDALLHRWLVMQLSLAFYPFAGLGASLSERITIIGVRLATVKLALMCGWRMHDGKLSEEDSIRIVQSLARQLDHIADPSFSLHIYCETGWVHEARLRGLLGV